MRLTLVLTVVLVTVLLAEVNSEKPRKFKKYKKHKTTSSTTEEIPEVKEDSSELDSSDPVQMMERDDQIEEEEENKKKAEVELVESKEKIKSNNVPIHDPCATKHCGAGRVCESTPEGKAQCVCVKVCPEEADPRRKVCSNHNETWGSDCSVYQMRCWCDHNTEQCISEQYKHVHIEYYGECRQMPECTESEMADFPRRMRDWLFNIMRDLADREELTPYYLKMEREAETNMTRRWTNAAIWKWCDLDGHPHDRSVSRHELFPIRAPLLALEHCIAPFLDGCDVNNDHRISLLEWGKCLELPEDDLEDKCEELREELKDE